MLNNGIKNIINYEIKKAKRCEFYSFVNGCKFPEDRLIQVDSLKCPSEHKSIHGFQNYFSKAPL